MSNQINTTTDLQKQIAETLTRQYMEWHLNHKHSTMYFFMEKNLGVPEDIIYVESAKNSHWRHKAHRTGFMFRKRLRPISPSEFFDCIKEVNINDLQIYVRNDEVICQNNQAGIFVKRCINKFNEMYDRDDMRREQEALKNISTSTKLNEVSSVSLNHEIGKN